MAASMMSWQVTGFSLSSWTGWPSGQVGGSGAGCGVGVGGGGGAASSSHLRSYMAHPQAISWSLEVIAFRSQSSTSPSLSASASSMNRGAFRLQSACAGAWATLMAAYCAPIPGGDPVAGAPASTGSPTGSSTGASASFGSEPDPPPSTTALATGIPSNPSATTSVMMSNRRDRNRPGPVRPVRASRRPAGLKVVVVCGAFPVSGDMAGATS
jgi:hypothetical protein